MIWVSVSKEDGFRSPITAKKALGDFANLVCTAFRTGIYQHPIAAAFDGIAVRYS